MKLLTPTIFLSLCTILTACPGDKPDKTIQDVFNHEQFDTSIIHRLYLYDSIKNILIANADTIYNYRKAKEKPATREEDATRAVEVPCEFFIVTDYPGSSDYMSTATLPPSIFPKVDSLCRQIGTKRLSYIKVERCLKRIEMRLKNGTDDETAVETFHTLTWNTGQNDNKDALEKDTVLTKGWVYDIYSMAYPGR